MATAEKTAEKNSKPSEAEIPAILSLETVNPKRAIVTIDGEPYEIYRLGDYGVEDQHAISQDSKEFDELWETPTDELGDEGKKRLKLLLDRLTDKALKAPKSVIKKLDAEQKKQITQVFTSASLQTLQRAVASVVGAMVEQEQAARDGSTSET